MLRRDDLSRAEWDALLAGFGVSTALVTFPAENPRAAFFDPERWALVYRAADGLVFVRRQATFAALIARAELPVTYSLRADTGRDSLADRSPPRGLAGGRLRMAAAARATSSSRPATTARATGRLSEAPREARPGCLDAAALAGRRGWRWATPRCASHDPATAVDAYAGIDLPRAHTNRALALLALGRAREALDEARARRWPPTQTMPTRSSAERLARERLPPPRPEPALLLRRPAEVEFRAPWRVSSTEVDRAFLGRIPIFAGLPERVLGLIAGKHARRQRRAWRAAAARGRACAQHVRRTRRRAADPQARQGRHGVQAGRAEGGRLRRRDGADRHPAPLGDRARGRPGDALRPGPRPRSASCTRSDVEAYALLVLNISREISRRLRVADEVLANMGLTAEAMWSDAAGTTTHPAMPVVRRLKLGSLSRAARPAASCTLWRGVAEQHRVLSL